MRVSPWAVALGIPGGQPTDLVVLAVARATFGFRKACLDHVTVLTMASCERPQRRSSHGHVSFIETGFWLHPRLRLCRPYSVCGPRWEQWLLGGLSTGSFPPSSLPLQVLGGLNLEPCPHQAAPTVRGTSALCRGLSDCSVSAYSLGCLTKE